MRDIAVFSGSAHPELAAEICAYLETPLQPVRVQRFANDCLEVQLQANCRERDVYLIQPLVPPVQEHLVELLLMCDAARGASAGYSNCNSTLSSVWVTSWFPMMIRAQAFHRSSASSLPSGRIASAFSYQLIASRKKS